MGKKSKKGQHHDADHGHHKAGQGTHSHHKHHGGPLYDKYHHRHHKKRGDTEHNDEGASDATTTNATTIANEEQQPPTAEEMSATQTKKEEIDQPLNTTRDLDWQMVGSSSGAAQDTSDKTESEAPDLKVDKEADPTNESSELKKDVTEAREFTTDNIRSMDRSLFPTDTEKENSKGDDANKSAKMIKNILQRSISLTLTGLPLWLLLAASSAQLLEEASLSTGASYALQDSLMRGTLIEDLFGFTSIVPWEFYCSWWFSSKSIRGSGLSSNRQGLGLGAWLAP